MKRGGVRGCRGEEEERRRGEREEEGKRKGGRREEEERRGVNFLKFYSKLFKDIQIIL